MARGLYPLLEPDMLLVADRNFYSFIDWCTAADTGADLLWRLADGVTLPLVAMLGDGSYTSVIFAAKLRRPERDRILADVRAGRDIDERKARAQAPRHCSLGTAEPRSAPTRSAIRSVMICCRAWRSMSRTGRLIRAYTGCVTIYPS